MMENILFISSNLDNEKSYFEKTCVIVENYKHTTPPMFDNHDCPLSEAYSTIHVYTFMVKQHHSFECFP